MSRLMRFRVVKIEHDVREVLVSFDQEVAEGLSSSTLILRLAAADRGAFLVGESYEFAWTLVPPLGVKALAALTFTGAALMDGDTVTVGTQTYTFKTLLTGAPDEVLIGAVTDSLSNLKAAVNAEAGIGVIYGTGTVANEDAVATILTGTLALAFETVVAGAAGNSVAKSGTSIDLAWDAGITFSGGSG